MKWYTFWAPTRKLPSPHPKIDDTKPRIEEGIVAFAQVTNEEEDKNNYLLQLWTKGHYDVPRLKGENKFMCNEKMKLSNITIIFSTRWWQGCKIRIGCIWTIITQWKWSERAMNALQKICNSVHKCQFLCWKIAFGLVRSAINFDFPKGNCCWKTALLKTSSFHLFTSLLGVTNNCVNIFPKEIAIEKQPF